MKQTFITTSVALAIVGFLGTGAVLAQQSNAPATTPSMPTAAPDAKAQPDNQGMPARTESGSSAFTKLDMTKRGYLNAEDVSKLQGFNFKNADKNGDGKLDTTEFNTAWTSYSGTPK